MYFFKDLYQKAVTSFMRFPVTLTWVILGSIYLIIFFIFKNTISSNIEVQLILSLGVSWLIGAQFVSEALSHSVRQRFALKVSVLSGLILYFVFGLKKDLDVSSITYGQWALLLLAGHVFVVFAPFVKSWNKNKFWDYLKSVIIALIRSGVYATVLYIGLAIAISTLEVLFKVNFNDNIYLQTLILCLGIVNTFVYLSDFPKLNNLGGDLKLPKAGEVLIIYILIPLSFLYISIVYLYAIKILIDWELPEGFVTYLISGLSLLAFVIHISLEPFRKKHRSKLIQKFIPNYFFAIFPLLPLLFIALYRRIADYNFTELRYLGLVLAFWISGMLIYMLWSRQKVLSLYAKSMFVLILLSTFGPLSAFKISINAQLNELGELVEKAESQNLRQMSSEEFSRFKNILDYLDERDVLGKTEAYFGFNPTALFSETSTAYQSKKILEKLKIEVKPSPVEKTLQNKLSTKGNTYVYKGFKLGTFKPNYAKDISDYTKYTELNLQDYRDKNKALILHFDGEALISLRYYDEVLFETNMSNYLKSIAEKYNNLDNATQDEFTFRFKNKKGDFMIIFDSLKYKHTDSQVIILNGRVKLFYRTYENLELP